MPCLRATIATDIPGFMPSATIWRFCSAVQRRRLPQVLISVPGRCALVRSVVPASPVCEERFAMPSSSVTGDIWPDFSRAAQRDVPTPLTPKPLQLQHERTGLERQIANTLQPDWKPASPEEIWQAVPDGSGGHEIAVYKKPGTAHEPHGEARYLVVAFSSKGVLKVAECRLFTQVNGLVDAACRAILRDKEGSVPCINQKPLIPEVWFRYESGRAGAVQHLARTGGRRALDAHGNGSTFAHGS